MILLTLFMSKYWWPTQDPAKQAFLKAKLTFEKFSSFFLAKRDLITPKGEASSKSLGGAEWVVGTLHYYY